jgi:hypothetical protein
MRFDIMRRKYGKENSNFYSKRVKILLKSAGPAHRLIPGENIEHSADAWYTTV